MLPLTMTVRLCNWFTQISGRWEVLVLSLPMFWGVWVSAMENNKIKPHLLMLDYYLYLLKSVSVSLWSRRKHELYEGSVVAVRRSHHRIVKTRWVGFAILPGLRVWSQPRLTTCKKQSWGGSKCLWLGEQVTKRLQIQVQKLFSGL